jgi:hypothetical protein
MKRIIKNLKINTMGSKLTYSRILVLIWTHFKNEQREHSKEDFEYESKRKTPQNGNQDQDGNNRLGKMSHKGKEE